MSPLTRRVIACLDVADGRIVKGVCFESLRAVGDPVERAVHYERGGADEIVILDISATAQGRDTLLELVRRAAEQLFVPLTVGGGIRTADDVGHALRAGADKVSINSAAVARPAVLGEAAERFGRQCVVASIDARREGARWRVVTHGGRAPTTLEAVAWAKTCAAHGAGEILLTSIDRDGGRSGYDLDLLRAVAAAVEVPVIASGGAGTALHLVDAIEAGADAVLVAGILHDGVTTVADLKAALAAAGVPVRGTAPAPENEREAARGAAIADPLAPRPHPAARAVAGADASAARRARS